MAFKTLTIKESTYKRIVKFKSKGESFSDLLDREFENKMQTSRDLLEWAHETVRTGGKNPLSQRKDSPCRARIVKK